MSQNYEYFVKKYKKWNINVDFPRTIKKKKKKNSFIKYPMKLPNQSIKFSKDVLKFFCTKNDIS